MLSGEGNENGEKTTICLISKKATLHVQHTFLYISLPLFCTTITRNFQKLPGYKFYRGNVVRVLVHIFSTVAHFRPGGRWHFLFSHRRYKISCRSSNEKCLLSFFQSRSSSFSRWASLACRLTFSVFICLSLSLFSKFVDMTINLNVTL